MSIANELLKLQQLKEAGFLTEEEFAEAKRSVLRSASAHWGAETTVGSHVNELDESEVARRIVKDIIDLAHRATSAQSEAQVKEYVSQISAKKSVLSSGSTSFLDLSVEIGDLVLTNDDVNLLADLTEQQRISIRGLYAPCCNMLDDKLTEEIGRMEILETLDLSYCQRVGWIRLRHARLPCLRDVYLRSCHTLTSTNIKLIAEGCPNIERLYLDHCPQMDDLVGLLRDRLPVLRLISLVGCRQLQNEDSKYALKHFFSYCTVEGP